MERLSRQLRWKMTSSCRRTGSRQMYTLRMRRRELRQEEEQEEWLGLGMVVFWIAGSRMFSRGMILGQGSIQEATAIP